MWKTYEEKPAVRQAIKVCDENIEAIKSIPEIQFGEKLEDGITIIEVGLTRKKVSNGDYIIKVGESCEVRNGEKFEAGWKLAR